MVDEYYFIKDDFSNLIGKVLSKIKKEKKENNDDVLVFYTQGDRDRNRDVYIMSHYRECCENVYIEDICGDLDDLIGSPILLAEEVTNRDNKPDNWDDSFTWTFYKLATNKGAVTLRWLGLSGGYYSEEVDFLKEVTLYSDLYPIVMEIE